jgi:RNA polymerase sigma factor (sigma-70 family)
MAHADGLEAAAERRSQEIERLFRDHNDSLVSFLALRLRSRQEAREVAQEAYVRLLQLERPDVSGFVRAYLFRIAGNLAIDRLRRRMTEARCGGEELFRELHSAAREPERESIEHERLRQVGDFIGEVPEVARRAFLMFRLEEKSQAEIAGELGITDRMVRYHITRVLVYCQLRVSGVERDEALRRQGWSPA